MWNVPCASNGRLVLFVFARGNTLIVPHSSHGVTYGKLHSWHHICYEKQHDVYVANRSYCVALIQCWKIQNPPKSSSVVAGHHSRFDKIEAEMIMTSSDDNRETLCDKHWLKATWNSSTITFLSAYVPTRCLSKIEIMLSASLDHDPHWELYYRRLCPLHDNGTLMSMSRGCAHRMTTKQHLCSSHWQLEMTSSK